MKHLRISPEGTENSAGYLMNREIVGILVGVVTLILILLGTYAIAAGAVILSFFMARELFISFGIRSAHVFVPLIAVSSWFEPSLGIFFSLLFCFMYGYGRWDLDIFFKTFFVGIYAGVLPSYLIHVRDQGLNEMLALVITVWAVDITAYYVGRKFGTVPLAQKLSPTKTMEGLWAGLISAVIVFPIISEMDLIKSAIVGLIIGISAVVGDLLKSFIKRQLDIKDFSHILGEHGGFVDRFDSLVFTAALYYCILL